ncbi:MAG TPA: helix-turn-helix domain-containing protein [Hyphomicrobiaceae bacterium]|nr:helix-turn-helix domain-containing protein [Hyphomicrobiaceae bacterium]
MADVQRHYVWRLYPTPEQADAMARHMRMCADLWNALLAMCEARQRHGVQRRGRSVSFHCGECAAATAAAGKIMLCEQHRLPTEYDMSYWITDMLRECPEWRELSTWTPRRVAGALADAYRAFFRRAKAGAGRASGYPRYKALARAAAIPYRSASGCAVRKSERHATSWLVRLKGVPGDIWARGQLPCRPEKWTDADVRYAAGRWLLSVAIVVEPRRRPAAVRRPITVRFGVLDGLAEVNGVILTPEGLDHARRLDERRAALQSAFDQRWPRGQRLSEEEWAERSQEWAEIARLAARAARVRDNALHIWTTRLARSASALTIYRPAIAALTASGRGTARQRGANVAAIAALNRTVRSYAPGRGIEMLRYKAAELGVPVQVLEDAAPEIGIGRELRLAGQLVRRARSQAVA